MADNNKFGVCVYINCALWTQEIMCVGKTVTKIWKEIGVVFFFKIVPKLDKEIKSCEACAF